MTLLILSLLSLTAIASYTGVMILREGIPYSVSATAYSLKNISWFMLTMALTGFLLAPVILDITPNNIQFVAFLAIVGLLAVGAAPRFKNKSDKTERVLHQVGAVMVLVFSQTWVGLMDKRLLLIWIAYIGYTAYMMVKKRTGNIKKDFMNTKPMFWIEVVALVTTYLTVFIGIYNIE